MLNVLSNVLFIPVSGYVLNTLCLPVYLRNGGKYMIIGCKTFETGLEFDKKFNPPFQFNLFNKLCVACNLVNDLPQIFDILLR